MKPSIGRIVLYKLSPADIAQIGGPLAHPLVAGVVRPAMIVEVHRDDEVDLKVTLGPFPDLWAPGRVIGAGEGAWSWPSIAANAPSRPIGVHYGDRI